MNRRVSNSSDLDFLDFKQRDMLISQMKLSLATNQRKIYIYDTINEDSVFETIYYLNKLIEGDRIRGEKLPINIYINSNGGVVDDGLTLVSFLESLKESGYVINTINIGRCFSMAFIIALVGTNRYAYRYATYMYHDVAGGVEGSLERMKAVIENIETTRKTAKEIVIKNSDLTMGQLEEIEKTKIDRFYGIEEALKYKICDQII